MASALATGEATPHAGGRPRRVQLFGISIDRITMVEAVEQIVQWIHADKGGRPCRCVVTPNVDHVVMLRSSESLRTAYQSASLVVADGWPVVTASRWLGQPLPERVAGSDLVPALFDTATEARPVCAYLLGGAEGIGERAATAIEARWPNVHVGGLDSPPYGFENDPEECARIEERIRAVSPDLLIVGLGAPKQEVWMHASRSRLAATVAIGAGATIDFLAGEQRRAPRWVQALGMEWFFRAARDPRRLAGRYARDMVVFPWICAQEWVAPWFRSDR